MIGFLIKKSFFDGWDNLLGIIIQNLLFICVLFGLFGTLSIPEPHVPLRIALLVVMVGLFSFTLAGTGANNYAYSRYGREGWTAFRKGILTSWRHALLAWFVNLLLISLVLFVMPFYLAYQNFLGLFITVLLFWTTVFTFIAMLYFFPLHYTMSGDRPLKTLKKCFIIMIDNLGVSLFLLLYTAIQTVISLFTMGLIPGTGGNQLLCMDTLKLLMLKYDYLEKNPEADRKHLPWYDMLYDDRESVGPRSFKGMIFPWKY